MMSILAALSEKPYYRSTQFIKQQLLFMTDQAIQKQIADIKKVTAEIVKSKESARKFLLDLGIIDQKEGVKNHTNKKV